MALNIPIYKTVTVTEGGADAFAETPIVTEISAADGMIWKVLGLEIAFDPAQLSGVSADGSIQWQLTRDTKNAISNYADPDVVMRGGLAWALTTSGMILMPVDQRWVPVGDCIFAEPTIYVALDSTATGAALVITARIYYELVKATELEILRMLQNV